ncbi:MAG: hypothetical protein H6739_37815 [Alphaproteobacteria bacterium]|nr:hypothetical protein [Alphaproteobacteria bacterium]
MRPHPAPATAILLATLSTTEAFAADCATPTTSAQVGAYANAAVDAFFVTSNKQAFVDAVEGMRAAVPCLGEVVSNEDAAALHFATALEALIAQRNDDVARSLRAAVNAAPGFTLTEEQAPQGSPLREALDDARRAAAPAAGQLALPPCVTLYVDGGASSIWSADRPALLQPVGPDGSPLWSRQVGPGERPPEVLFDCPQDGPVASASRRGGSSPAAKAVLGSGAVASAAAAGLFWWRAAAAHSDFDTFADDVANNASALDGYDSDYPEVLQSRANGFSAAAIGAGVLALGLGTTLVVTW